MGVEEVSMQSDIVKAFLAEIIAVCRKHKLYLSHQDGHGAFQVERLGPTGERPKDWMPSYNLENWLGGAEDMTTEEKQ